MLADTIGSSPHPISTRPAELSDRRFFLAGCLGIQALASSGVRPVSISGGDSSCHTANAVKGPKKNTSASLILRFHDNFKPGTTPERIGFLYFNKRAGDCILIARHQTHERFDSARESEGAANLRWPSAATHEGDGMGIGRQGTRRAAH